MKKIIFLILIFNLFLYSATNAQVQKSIYKVNNDIFYNSSDSDYQDPSLYKGNDQVAICQSGNDNMTIQNDCSYSPSIGFYTMTFENGEGGGACEGLSLQDCRLSPFYTHESSFEVAKARLAAPLIDSDVDALNSNMLDYFYILLTHFWPFLVGALILVLSWFFAKLIIQRIK